MISIYYCRIDHPFSDGEWQQCLGLLPEALQQKAKAYYRRQDALAFVAGKFLLQQGMKALGLDSFSLDDIRYTKFMRPCLQRDVDFNISHSGRFVVCAISHTARLGIDIEEVRPVDLSDFTSQWTREEWQSIMDAEDSLYRFYEYWTKKEAVIKADGRGMYIPLKRIDVRSDRSMVEGNLWYLRRFYLADDHISHLAVNNPGATIRIHETDLPTMLQRSIPSC